MKGHLYKKEQPEGQYVVYDIDGFTKGKLPLHPEYQTILPLDLEGISLEDELSGDNVIDDFEDELDEEGEYIGKPVLIIKLDC